MTLGEVKRHLNKTVIYDGNEYIFKACKLFLDPVHREFKYSAELTSVKTNAGMCVPLNKIITKENFNE